MSTITDSLVIPLSALLLIVFSGGALVPLLRVSDFVLHHA